MKHRPGHSIWRKTNLDYKLRQILKHVAGDFRSAQTLKLGGEFLNFKVKITPIFKIFIYEIIYGMVSVVLLHFLQKFHPVKP